MQVTCECYIQCKLVNGLGRLISPGPLTGFCQPDSVAVTLLRATVTFNFNVHCYIKSSATDMSVYTGSFKF